MAYEWTHEKTGQPLNKTKSVDGVVVDLTAEEISAIEAKREIAEAEATTIANTEAKKETDAKAGNDKLIELGLTQDQVTAMTGYTPQSEE